MSAQHPESRPCPACGAANSRLRLRCWLCKEQFTGASPAQATLAANLPVEPAGQPMTVVGKVFVTLAVVVFILVAAAVAFFVICLANISRNLH